jgi:nitrite reductase/ring-hydroxylating ferredoxin subunit
MTTLLTQNELATMVMKEPLLLSCFVVGLSTGFQPTQRWSHRLSHSHDAFGARRLYDRPFSTTTALATATLNLPSTTEVATEPAADARQFQWFKQWYPVVPVEILDPEKPSKFTLMGMDLVIWNDGVVEGSSFQSKKKRPRGAKKTLGQWRAFVDECPHRKVPLSEGRVEDDGTLLCSGACTAIPQMGETSDFERVQRDPKSQCNSFPTTVQNGILWIWPSNDKDATLESALSPPRTSDADQDDRQDLLFIGPWNYRELPYGADYFIENVVDPGTYMWDFIWTSRYLLTIARQICSPCCSFSAVQRT